MAVRTDFVAGEVLAAQDLDDTFGSKISYAYGTATPTTTVSGFVWFDTNFTPPVAKVWNGSAFVNFSQGPADFSDAATGTYTDSGVNYKYITFTGSGTLTVTRAGFVDVLLVGGGGGGGAVISTYDEGAGGGGGGGAYQITNHFLKSGSCTITVGAGGASRSNGGFSRCDVLYSLGGGYGGTPYVVEGQVGGSGGGGSGLSKSGGSGITGQGNNGVSSQSFNYGAGGGGGGGTGSNQAGGAALTNSISNSALAYGGGGGGGQGTGAGGVGSGGTNAGSGGATNSGGSSGSANRGGGGGGAGNRNTGGTGSGGSGGSGIVIIRVRTN